MANPNSTASQSTVSVTERTACLLHAHELTIWTRTDRLFVGLLAFEWLAGILLVLWRSPRTWDGATSHINPHVWVATLLGSGVISLPVYLVWMLPGRCLTRHVIAISQMMMSGILIHLGGGRPEMHFQIFGSLAFLAFYRDWRVLITASAVTAGDHLLRGIYLPQTIYGVASASIWRTLEHAGWVIFEDIFLITSCIQGVREMRGIAEKQTLLEQSYHDVEGKVIERTQQLKDAQQDLMKVARSAGMAEIATSVLHNVGNVLNSVNVSASVVAEKLRQSEVGTLARVGEMFTEHKPDLATFLTQDERGKMIPDFLNDLATCLGEEQRAMLDEVSALTTGIEHIKQIVAAQQSLAKRGNLRTAVDPRKLFETALTMQSTTATNEIEIVKRFEETAAIPLDEHKVLQILINLISNARQAVSRAKARRVILTIAEAVTQEGNVVRFQVSDNGEGIAVEHLTRIFSHGFTTKADGHGFGLHSAANAAAEMGGSLTAASDGPGTGATFTLDLPIKAIAAGEPCRI